MSNFDDNHENTEKSHIKSETANTSGPRRDGEFFFFDQSGAHNQTLFDVSRLSDFIPENDFFFFCACMSGLVVPIRSLVLTVVK